MSLTAIRVAMTVAAVLVWAGWSANGFDTWGAALVVSTTVLAALWWSKPERFGRRR